MPSSQTNRTGPRTSPRIVRKHKQRREDILREAAVVFAEVGYHRTSLEEIAERLDLTRASLYHYFPGKDALLSACLEYGAEHAISLLAETAAEGDGKPAAEQLRDLIVAQLLIITHDAPELSRLFLSSMDWPDAFRSRVKQLREQHDAYFRKAITRGLETGEFSSLSPEVARHCLHGAMNYAAVWLRPRHADFSRNVQAVADALLLMFGVTD